MDFHQKKAGPDYHRLKTMVKRSTIHETGILGPEAEIMKETWTKDSGRLLAMGVQRAVF